MPTPAATINAVKQAAEFGIQQSGQKLVAFLLFINDVHSMGLKVAQGLQLMEAFYWDMNDDTRAFAKRFAARPGMNGKMPSGNRPASMLPRWLTLMPSPRERER